MIITSHLPLKVGQRYTEKELPGGIEIIGTVHLVFAILVVRVATKKEFLAYIKAEYPNMWYNIDTGYAYFYEIQTD